MANKYETIRAPFNRFDSDGSPLASDTQELEVYPVWVLITDAQAGQVDGDYGVYRVKAGLVREDGWWHNVTHMATGLEIAKPGLVAVKAHDYVAQYGRKPGPRTLAQICVNELVKRHGAAKVLHKLATEGRELNRDHERLALVAGVDFAGHDPRRKRAHGNTVHGMRTGNGSNLRIRLGDEA